MTLVLVDFHSDLLWWISFVAFVACIGTIIYLVCGEIARTIRRRRSRRPRPLGGDVNDFQIYSGGIAVPHAYAHPFAPADSPVRDALKGFRAERGGIAFGGPLPLVFDWDWPEAPKVSAPVWAPAAMPDHWPAWRMANWTPEEWAEFARASFRRQYGAP